LGDKVPDAKTIWLFRDTLSKSGRMKELFDLFAGSLEQQGIITRRGSIIDASFADAPRQRNTHDENKEIKEGKVPDSWEKKGKQAKLRQKDTDARWTKKNNQTHYGNHQKPISKIHEKWYNRSIKRGAQDEATGIFQ
jgi:IS5 family transposase